MNQTIPFQSSASVAIIAKEAMAYKQQIKENELITKIRIIRSVKKDRIPLVQVASAFSAHRNTIRNIITLFETTVSDKEQQQLLNATGSVTYEELKMLYGSLLNKSRKPHSHKHAATKEEEQAIVDLFTKDGIRKGIVGMQLYLARRYKDDTSSKAESLKQLSIGKLRGIYQRNGLLSANVRSANGERRHLYDYASLGCFERLHYDVKHIRDKHALPQHIYDLLGAKEIPKYEWNLIDAKSRFRFMAYSYNLNSSYGLWFLLFVVQFLRRYLVAYDTPIICGEDNGSEFCSGSKRKENDWNSLLTLLNASVYQYEPNFDIRKNLIERSHLTDDEELFIPRGHLFTSREAFRTEVTDYAYYWNVMRNHTGLGMQNRTPLQVVQDSGLTGGNRLESFPLLILDEVIDPLRNCIQPLLFEQFAKANPEVIAKAQTDEKTKRNLEINFPFLFNAQNVLTYYQIERFLEKVRK